jgi:hypothetical protein
MDPDVDPLWMESVQQPGAGIMTFDGNVVLSPREGPVIVWRNELAASVRFPAIVSVGEPLPSTHHRILVTLPDSARPRVPIIACARRRSFGV